MNTADEALGFRSRTVLQDIGSDLRACFYDTMMSPMPLLLQGLLDEMLFAMGAKPIASRSPVGRRT